MVYIIIAFVLFAAASFVLVSALVRSLPQEKRLPVFKDEMRQFGLPQASDKIPALFSFKQLQPLLFLAKPFRNLKYLERLKAQTTVLMMNLDIQGMILIKIFLAILGGIITFAFIYRPYAGLGVFIGFFVPDFIILHKVNAKKAEIVRVFPETVDLLDMCINAGSDFVSAIRWLIEKSDYNPLIEQLGLVLNEIQVGKARSEALKDLALRLKITEVSSFVRLINQSERMGTSIEEAFRNLSEDTRNTRFQSGERYAIKASLKIIFPLVLCILPAIIIVVAGPIIVRFSQGDLIPKGM